MIDDKDEEILEEGATGETSEVDTDEEESEESDEEELGTGETGTSEALGDVETAQYTVTGLIDTFDEQMNITGTLPIGSVQTLPVAIGDKAVADGTATKVE